MNSPNLSQLTLIAIEAAIRAGLILKKGFGLDCVIDTKPGKQNLVTEYDRASEACIISFIKEEYPTHRFLAEESGLSKKGEEGEILWIIDPLDGTTNFTREIPIFTISIAAYQEGKCLSGVVFQPMTNELFIAEKGKGAFLNQKRLKISKVKSLEKSMIMVGLPYEASFNPMIGTEDLTTLVQQGAILRNLGSAALALAYIAAGRIDAFWMYNLYLWDIAAGQLLIEEAGGKCTRYGTTPSLIESPLDFLATNEYLHSPLQNILFNLNYSKTIDS